MCDHLLIKTIFVKHVNKKLIRHQKYDLWIMAKESCFSGFTKIFAKKSKDYFHYGIMFLFTSEGENVNTERKI